MRGFHVLLPHNADKILSVTVFLRAHSRTLFARVICDIEPVKPVSD
jgi:hypothetical protein